MKVVTMKDFEKESKRRESKENVKRKFSNAVNFVGDHKEEILLFIQIMISDHSL